MNAVTMIEGNALAQGLQYGLDIDAYHSGPGISKTGLDSISANPAIYYARHLDPNRPDREGKTGQLEGSLAHCAILEPDQFLSRYIVGPDVNRNTKEWRAFEADSGGKECIKPDQYTTAMHQADSVRGLPEVRAALATGHAETSAFWFDPATGELCRCRPDFVHEPNETGVILLDVKTCSDASAGEFARQIARKRYHVQDAFYSDGYGIASGKHVLAFIFVAVESEWPYAAAALMLDQDGRDAGRRAYQRNLATYAECRKTGVWPGYSDQIEIINLPAWAMKEAA